VVNHDYTRALERAWIIKLLNRHGIDWSRLRRSTTMTHLLAQPDGRVSKSMSARKGDASRYYLKSWRLEEQAMEAGACCNSSSPRHAAPHFATPRRTQMRTHTYERRAIYFSEDTHECIRTQEKKHSRSQLTPKSKTSSKSSNPIIFLREGIYPSFRSFRSYGANSFPSYRSCKPELAYPRYLIAAALEESFSKPPDESSAISNYVV
jgi:hypothetical protein